MQFVSCIVGVFIYRPSCKLEALRELKPQRPNIPLKFLDPFIYIHTDVQCFFLLLLLGDCPSSHQVFKSIQSFFFFFLVAVTVSQKRNQCRGKIHLPFRRKGITLALHQSKHCYTSVSYSYLQDSKATGAEDDVCTNGRYEVRKGRCDSVHLLCCSSKIICAPTRF